MYLVEITAIINSSGTSAVLRYATESYTTSPVDSPANTHYEGRIVDVGIMSRLLFSDLKTGGSSQVGRGDLVLSNADGALDSIATYGFDGQPVVLKYGESQAAFSSLSNKFTATIAAVEFDMMRVVVRLRDPLEILNKPHLVNKYNGTNVLPDGLEGNESDLKDKVKPRIYGKVFNITPPLVNTSKHIYQVSDSAINGVDAVYDKGVELTAGSAYSTLADVSATAPSAGQYRAYLAGGLIRLGSSPDGTITADVTHGASAANRTAAQLIKHIALDGGVSAGVITAGDVTALDTANSAELGIYIDSDMTTLAALDAIAQSVGVWYGFDIAGNFRMGQLIAPSGSPVYAITYLDIVDIERVASNDEKNGIPTYRVSLNYQKYYTTQNDSDLAGSVTDERKSALKNEYRTVKAEDLTVLTQHKLSPELKKDTLLVTKAATDTEASRQLTLFKVYRESYKVTISTNSGTAPIDLGKVVSLTFSRFNLSAGKLFIVIGIETDYHHNRATLTLWG